MMPVIHMPFYAKLLIASLCLFIFCEFGIYYVVLLQCQWPDLSETFPSQEPDAPLRAMLLADTHLLGPRKGHWFDKLRREWQMHRAFQTAMNIHDPEVVFVLGDVFDEGLWVYDKEFDEYVERFHSLFRVPKDTKLYVVVGNHDIGFHYSITPRYNRRFVKAFDADAVRLLTLKGNHFVLLNSMAMEGDKCSLCQEADSKIKQLGKALDCAKKKEEECSGTSFRIARYSQPILLQHFPLYRESDAMCREPDEAPIDEKHLMFRERWECLSKESTEMLTRVLEPRLIMTGHTHHGCRLQHSNGAQEWTLPSFNWRNKNNPSFALAVITPANYSISKCYMPQESTVINLYILGGFACFLFILVSYKNAFGRLSARFSQREFSIVKGK